MAFRAGQLFCILSSVFAFEIAKKETVTNRYQTVTHRFPLCSVVPRGAPAYVRVVPRGAPAYVRVVPRGAAWYFAMYGEGGGGAGLSPHPLRSALPLLSDSPPHSTSYTPSFAITHN